MRGDRVVIDASALLDLLVTRDVGLLVESRIQDCSLHAPSHIDGEVFSRLEDLAKAGILDASALSRHAETLAAAPIERHSVAGLLAGASRRPSGQAFTAALYVELANTIGAPLITTDPETARKSPVAELISLNAAH
jgi:predicted nucleic acid-binding protein